MAAIELGLPTFQYSALAHVCMNCQRAGYVCCFITEYHCHLYLFVERSHCCWSYLVQPSSPSNVSFPGCFVWFVSDGREVVELT